MIQEEGDDSGCWARGGVSRHEVQGEMVIKARDALDD
jgi:hypothetical protein